MSVDFPQDFREAVRAQTDIVSLIGEAVALHSRRGGREFVGLCCFHDDHNPSMVVSPDRQTFRCWSCNTGGDVFTFVQEREKVSFREALEILAKRAGIAIPQKVSGRSEHEEANRARLFEVMQWAENLFHRALLNEPYAEKARKYLYSRGYDEAIIREYKLGYHPPNWDWIQDQSRHKYPVKLLHQARLVGQRDDGSHYDYFVDRVLFSIHNERGQPVAFGGRVLPGSTDDRKYFNSPESDIFHKSRLLYGIDKARDAIREENCVLITEGYTDTITCHQYGVKNVVATLGTALTDSHVTAVKRHARKVVLVFDGDDAGQNAAFRAVERFLTQDVDLRILSLPGKKDPAEFLDDAGGEALTRLINTAPEAWEFAFQVAQVKHGIDTIDGRARTLEEMLNLLAKVPSMAENVKEGLFIANLAQRLAVPEQKVRDRLKELRQLGSRRPTRVDREPEDRRGEGISGDLAANAPVRDAIAQQVLSDAIRRLMRGQQSKDDKLECDLLEMVVADPTVLPDVRRVLSTDPEGGSLEPHEAAAVLRHPALRALLEVCLELATVRRDITFQMILDQLTEETTMTRLVVWLDERGRVKNLADKIHSHGVDPVDDCPLLVKRSLANLTRRSEEQSQQQVDIQLSQHSKGLQGLDAEALALLSQSQEFHKHRATKRAGS